MDNHREPLQTPARCSTPARCATCARLAKTRRDSPDMAERANADAEFKAHLNGVFAMRRVDMRFSQMSAASCEPGCTLPNRCLHIRIDGLDQPKGVARATSKTASNGQASGAHSCILWV